MWFRKSKFTSKAIAYLKAEVPSNDPAPSVSLSHDDSPVLRNLNNGLLVFYVVDSGNQFEYVQNRHLTRDRIDSEQLHSSGITNLETIAAQGTRVSPHPDGHMFAVVLDGNFESSLILVDSLWQDSFRQFVTGQYAIAIPARDILAFCDASSSQGVQELRQLIDRLKDAGADHPISNDLYVRIENEWQILDG